MYSYLYGALCAYVKSNEFCRCRWHTSRGYVYNTGILVLWSTSSQSQGKRNFFLLRFSGLGSEIMIILRHSSKGKSTKALLQIFRPEAGLTIWSKHFEALFKKDCDAWSIFIKQSNESWYLELLTKSSWQIYE